MDSSQELGSNDDGIAVDKGRHQRQAGKLIYLDHSIPDISFSISSISQFMNDPHKEHMETVYKTLRYLKWTPGKGLYLKTKGERDTEIYTDADRQT